jgi:hypothetical protein
MRVNAEGARTRVVGWIPMSVEFTHQLLVSHRIVDQETNLLMTAAFLTAQRYNTAAAIANRCANPGDSPAAFALDSLLRRPPRRWAMLRRRSFTSSLCSRIRTYPGFEAETPRCLSARPEFRSRQLAKLTFVPAS